MLRKLGLTGAFLAGVITVIALGSAYVGPAPVQPSQTTALDLYASWSSGNDANSCQTSSAPCKTLQGALNKLPKVIKAPVTVHAMALPDGGADNQYADIAADAGAQATMEVDAFQVDRGANVAAKFTISCATKTILASAQVTGYSTTVDAGLAVCLPDGGTAACGLVTSPPVVTVSGAAWTPSAFKDDFLEVVSGTGAGLVMPIVDNTATTITVLPDFDSLDNTSVFSVVAPSVAISNATAAAPSTAAVPYAVRFSTDTAPFDDTAYEGADVNTMGIVIDGCALSAKSWGGFTNPSVAVDNSVGIGLMHSQVANSSGTYGMKTSGRASMMIVDSTVHSAGLEAIYLDGDPQLYVEASTVVAPAIYQGVGTDAQSVVNVRSLNSYYAPNSAFAFFLNGLAGRVYSYGDHFNCSATADVAQINSPGAALFLDGANQYGTGVDEVALLQAGTQFWFTSSIKTISAHFTSLDDGVTFTSKAAVEAATNKAIHSAATGALAKEQ
jgi:hypothetical protein